MQASRNRGPDLTLPAPCYTIHFRPMLQLSGNTLQDEEAAGGTGAVATLVELRRGEQAVLESLDLPEDEARRLMELGFIPGSPVTVGLSAPGGDPRVFRVDGSEVALRGETAARLRVRLCTPDERA